VAQRDHYVSQTYLEHFTNDRNQLVPYYKDGRVVIGKPKSPKSICHEKDGDANTYFDDPRLLDKYLAPFEQNWSTNVQALCEMRLNQDIKYQLSAYVAYLRACNPVAKRMGQDMLAETIQPIAEKVMRKSINNPNLGPELQANLIQELQKDNIRCVVDRDYSHARGIASLIALANRLFCSGWLKLFNETDIPFITIDNPSVLHYRSDSDPVASIFIPVSPNNAILISPDKSIERPTSEDVQHYRSSLDRYASINKKYVNFFNQLVVKSAERIVMHATVERWIEELMIKYRSWRMKNITSTIKYDNGIMIIHRQKAIDSSNA
jgi:hypothetical protein